jgi:hypothetical protein
MDSDLLLQTTLAICSYDGGSKGLEFMADMQVKFNENRIPDVPEFREAIAAIQADRVRWFSVSKKAG